LLAAVTAIGQTATNGRLPSTRLKVGSD
jgi:hypothetical protein